jgi:hypothetical protein
MKKLLFILLAFISYSASAQVLPTPNKIWNRQAFMDSVFFHAYKNNANEDSVLTVDKTTSKLKFVIKGGTDNAAFHTATASADSTKQIFSKPNGDIVNYVFDGNVGGGGGSGTITNGNATTANGTAVDLGGAATKDINFNMQGNNLDFNAVGGYFDIYNANYVDLSVDNHIQANRQTGNIFIQDTSNGSGNELEGFKGVFTEINMQHSNGVDTAINNMFVITPYKSLFYHFDGRTVETFTRIPFVNSYLAASVNGVQADNTGNVITNSIKSTGASLTTANTDYTILVTTSGQTITLPTAVGLQGHEYIIKLTAAGTATVATTSSQTIDGATTYTLSAQYKYVKIQSNNANWFITANN